MMFNKPLYEFVLPDLIEVDDSKVYRYLSKLYLNELTNCSKPCYVPKYVKYYGDIKHLTMVKDHQISEFKKSISSKYDRIDMYNDKHVIMFNIILLKYVRSGKIDIAKMVFNNIGLKFYSSRYHTHFKKFCSSEMWQMALDRISDKHLFRKRGSIPSAIDYLNKDTFDSKINILKNPKLDDKMLIGVIYYLRTRINQSMRSFSNMYYKLIEENIANQNTDTESEKIEGPQLIAEKISMMICTYNQVDKDALNRAIGVTSMRKEYAIDIIKSVSDSRNKARVSFLIILLSRLENLSDICYEKTRSSIVRKVMSNKMIGKYRVKEEVLRLINESGIEYTTRTVDDDQKIRFFIQYLTLYIQRRIC